MSYEYSEKRFEYNEYLQRLNKQQLIHIINQWMDQSEDGDELPDPEEELQEIIELLTAEEDEE